MKCKQPYPGFELSSLCPFSTTMTLMPRAPRHICSVWQSILSSIMCQIFQKYRVVSSCNTFDFSTEMSISFWANFGDLCNNWTSSRKSERCNAIELLNLMKSSKWTTKLQKSKVLENRWERNLIERSRNHNYSLLQRWVKSLLLVSLRRVNHITEPW